MAKTRLALLALTTSLRISGDVGPLTTYTSKHRRKVAYPIAPPRTPPTAPQLKQRYMWRTIANDWTRLTTAEKLQWNELAFKAKTNLTGYALFTWAESTANPAPFLSTLQRQASLPSLPPYKARRP